MKLCINCKHVVFPTEHDNKEVSRCAYNHPTSLITGLLTPYDKLPYCAVQRLNHEPCKIAGDLWEAADHVMTPEEEEQMLKEANYV